MNPGRLLPLRMRTFGAIGQGVIHRKALDAVGIGRLPAAEGDRPRRPGSFPGSGDRSVKISNQNNNGEGGRATWRDGWGQCQPSSYRPPFDELTLRPRGVPLCEPFDSAFWKALTHPSPPRRGLSCGRLE